MNLILHYDVSIFSVEQGDDHVVACVVSPKGNMVQNIYCPSQYCDRHLIVST